jgi:hypothetical protein
VYFNLCVSTYESHREFTKLYSEICAHYCTRYCVREENDILEYKRILFRKITE